MRNVLVETIMPDYNQSNSLVLPKWLNDWLKEQNAFYEVDRTQILDGRKLSDYGVQWYLGSYFPKSYVESYTIYTDLFSKSEYYEILKDKESISILDVGCGTGGNTVGLITSIIVKLPRIKKILIDAFDYCENSLEALKSAINCIIGQFNSTVKIEITTESVHFAPETTEDTISFNDFVAKRKNKYDIILSFKMINELVRNAGFNINSVYSQFAAALCALLSDVGTFTIEDVSDKVNDVYLSKPLGASIHNFVTDNQDYIIISPVPCSINQNCRDNCFMQRILKVTFESKYIDTENGEMSSDVKIRTIDTQVVYRIIAKRQYALNIVPVRMEHRYEKVFKRQNARSTSTDDHYCGPQDADIRDAFTLNQS